MNSVVTNILITANITMLGVVAALLKILYNQLVSNDKNLFGRMSNAETEITALKAACGVRHKEK